MQKKRLLGVAMAALVAVNLAGCAGGNKASTTTEPAGSAPTTMEKQACSGKEGCGASKEAQ